MSFLNRLRTPPVSTALKAALALAVVGYLVYFIEVDAIVAAAAGAEPAWIGAAALLLPLNVLLETQTWRCVMRPVRRLPFRTALGALLAGFALGLFTPARAGDFVGRAFYLDRPDGWTTSLTVLVQRLADMAAALGLGAAVLLAAMEAGWMPARWWPLAPAGGAGAAALTGLLLMPRRAVGWARRLTSSAPVRRRLALLGGMRPRHTLPALGCALARHAVYVTQLVLLLRAFAPAEAGFTAARAYAGGAIMYLAKFLVPQITLMDFGIREGLAVFFFGQLGFAEAAAFNAALLLFALNLALPAAVGFPFVLRLRLRRRARAAEAPPARAAAE